MFLSLCLAALAAAFALALVRLAKGPTVADRSAAGDTAYLVAVAMIALLTVRNRVEVFADVVLIATLVGFLSALALAWYLDRRSS